MKKIIASALLVGSLFSAAQAAEKDDFQFGIRLGAQFSNVKGNIITPNPLGVVGAIVAAKDESKALIGPAFGFIFEIPVHANFEIRPEINFGSQGRRFQDGDVVYSQWLGSVQVPVLFRGQYGNETVRGFVQAGPQFGYGAFLLDRFRNGNDIQEKNSYSLKDVKLKPFDAGISVGAGVEFPALKGMEVEARYYAGLTDINDHPLVSEKTTNQSVSLTVAFKF